jgi:hypothetical protein
MMREPEPIRKLNPSVPKPLADAIMRCLAKEPIDRFQTTADLSAELQRVNFNADYQPVVEGTSNFAMPFFAGLTVASVAASWLAGSRYGLLGSREWMLIAGGCALLSIVCSPVVRASTDPWSAQARIWIGRRLKK